MAEVQLGQHSCIFFFKKGTVKSVVVVDGAEPSLGEVTVSRFDLSDVASHLALLD